MDSHSVQTEPLTRLGRIITGLAGLVAVGGMVLLIGVLLYNRLHHVAAAVEGPAVQLVPGSNDILDVAPEVRSALGVFTAPVKKAGSRDRLELLGSLFIDPSHMVRVRSRFGGEVVSIGPGDAGTEGKNGEPQPLRVGDRVKQGQLLAVVWSKDLGETKSDLVDALSQLAQHERQYKKLQSLDKGLVSQKDVQDAQRMREADLIKVETLERTLRSWKLPQSEIDEAHVEAEKIHQGKPNDIAAEQHWAEVEVRSPQDGVILERSITLGDFVTTDADMFKIAEVSTLGVLVQVYEDNLPDLTSLPPEERQWTVHLKSQPGDRGTNGSFDAIGKVIDPTQHTTTVTGWVDNRSGRLRVGQFVTAVIDLPAVKGEVVIPRSSLIEQSNAEVVFVTPNREAERIERRLISVARRARDQIFVHSEPDAAARAAGCKPLKAGELVVTSGAVELAGALQDALAARPPAEAAPKTSEESNP